MKKNILLHTLWLLIVCLFATSCSEDDNSTKSDAFTLTDTATPQLAYEKESRATISFTCTESWKASIDVDWATATPMTGQAGASTISLIARQSNGTGQERTGTLTLTSASGSKKTISFTQAFTDVINLENIQYDVDAAGGDVTVNFTTNVSGYKVLYVVGGTDVSDWISGKKDANTQAQSTGILDSCSYVFTIKPNTTRTARTASFYIKIVDTDNHDVVKLQSQNFTISQKGLEVGTSTDYSADNKVTRLKTHTAGNGMPVIIMGDGFIDTEIASGHYMEVMTRTMQQLFTEEPAKSMQEYFDVWAVTKVSQNNAFGDGYKTALGCTLAGNGSTSISCDANTILTNVRHVSDMSDANKLKHALVVVILNTPERAGTTNFKLSIDGEVCDYAISYVPLIGNDPDSEAFRSVLCHEALGHGIGKLIDEYSYAGTGTVATNLVQTYSALQKDYGWAQNISFSQTNVPWQALLNDSHYAGTDANGEKLGIYQGACGYEKGAWRPTDDSMMRNNTHGFNAPSRQAIYTHIMQAAYGSSWTFNLNNFITFDQQHLPKSTASKASLLKARQSVNTPLGLPIIGNHR